MSDISAPSNCTDMSQVRAGVDDVDRQLVALLARRFGYMDAAARIKPTREAVRDEWSKAEGQGKGRCAAADKGGDRDLVARLYEDRVETRRARAGAGGPNEGGLSVRAGAVCTRADHARIA